MNKIKISAVPKEGFCRCGRRWSHEGDVVDADDFTAEQAEILKSEKMLKIELVEDAEDDLFEEGSKEALNGSKERLPRLMEIFSNLGPEGLKQDGIPKVSVVEVALGAKISAAEVNEAWAVFQSELESQTGE
ncbi:MAG: hypothetical protein BA863_08985 [Desulfovibrio sp. S3730MH75]|nr:MAG: hypothetical protein BA863_08985 [Desulfovibrio sp. S3730MH75]